MKKQTWQQWARAIERGVAKGEYSPSCLRRGALASLTGQDTRALDAFVAVLELYSNCDGVGEQAALSAMRALLPAMQAKTRWIARELIPFVFDWHYRDTLWPRIVPRETTAEDVGAYLRDVCR